MGQKVNPRALRLAANQDWSSRWFEDKKYKETLLEDYKIRKSLMERLKHAGISEVQIERSINNIKITAFVSKPGMVIGRGGTGLEELKLFLAKLLDKKTQNQFKMDIRVEPIKEPNLNAYLVAKNMSEQLVRRLPAKRVMKSMGERVMGSGAKGVRIVLSGRIGGAEIGRREKLQQGTVPLSTIRANIDYASSPALTKKGYIGVKVWINKGEEK
ncbi:MAG: 30S ribosomal protein S3 [Candidatus Levybacteria bacterium GW2011_GWB1_35_5]|uniref:30S ribosomal protein S3 n=1 Tax=uncultured organism TaxID=155900 RepID=U3GWE7_9ZZZZ|nr:30S ribosomal protein S3 [uncultured organism]KKP79847.1 MAG: 30S ribosomal protein S3 [Candidatus Levybacteria bacterium GW2011_GWB1_35_5]